MTVSRDLNEFFGQNSGFVSELFELFQKDPGLVPSEWAQYFESLPDRKDAEINGRSYSNGELNGKGYRLNGNAAANISSSVNAGLQERVFRLINSYRSFGHLKAKINPLSKGIFPLPKSQDLNIEQYGFTESELSSTVACDGFQGKSQQVLSQLIQDLEDVYCNSIGFEFKHLLNQEERNWLQEKIESRNEKIGSESKEEKARRLRVLIDAETFEAELHKKYVGHKRFSLEGGETVIPMLDTLLSEGVEKGVEEAFIGMAHRGRLNVLVHTVGKPMEEVFNEFEDQSIFSALGSGDVKYHLGYSSTFKGLNSGSMRVSLACNPSHLEAVDPVLMGMVRARQDLSHGGQRKSVLPILIHGDAAVIGQGVVYETLNLSRVHGYKTGGAFHVVINNQIGFTTNPEDSRSSTYCTDATKAFEVPVFHVNCEDVEAACWVTKLALEFRLKYERDVVVDMYCWRKYGHNEGDDPSFTQPLSYSEIKQKKSSATLYAEYLIASGVLSKAEVDGLYASSKDKFHSAQERKAPKVKGEACSVHGRLQSPLPSTGVDRDTLDIVAQSLLTYPSGFVVHPKLKQILEKRVASLAEGEGIDWGFAETLAYGSLVLEGRRIRLSGQDSGRGTFSHRHLALNNYEKPEIFYPLSTLSAHSGAGIFEVFNSTLSEAGVLGFEYGYSVECPEGLILWEAQFGDFANGAQIHIDQFITSSEAKWNLRSSVVMLLPHGYEGQGPEHSSARLERFLQLCAEGNITVAYPTNSRQYFHLLRRQGVSEIKRPLVVMTPKSLLRLPDATCKTSDLLKGSFDRIIDEDLSTKGKERHVVFLTGKVYYDLMNELKQKQVSNLKLIRVEQLYPFPLSEIRKALKDLKVKTVSWIQEEPKNMGAWTFVEPLLREELELDVKYIGRPESASPSTGSLKRHGVEQKAFINELIKRIS
jgi:2-oxoglutarate dehydrogenase E1 component